MFDSSLITYAESLHFSQKANEIIISTLQAIADETGNSFMIEIKFRRILQSRLFMLPGKKNLQFTSVHHFWN